MPTFYVFVILDSIEDLLDNFKRRSKRFPTVDTVGNDRLRQRIIYINGICHIKLLMDRINTASNAALYMQNPTVLYSSVCIQIMYSA